MNLYRFTTAMYNKMKSVKIIGCTAILLLLFAGCSKNNNTNINPSKNGNTQVQISDIKAHPGNGRIKFSWKLTVSSDNDKSAGETVIFWDGNKDSLQVPVTSQAGSSIKDSVMISNLPEGKYNFVFVGVANGGIRSTRVLKKAMVYGTKYEASLDDREINNAKYNKDKKSVMIHWGSPNKGAIATKLTYINSIGTTVHIKVSPTSDSTQLSNYSLFNNHIKFTYQSLYLPEPAAIDTFAAPVDSINKKFLDWPAYFNPASGASAEGNIPPVCSEYPQTGGWQSHKVFYKNGRLQYQMTSGQPGIPDHMRIPDYSYAGYHYGEKSIPNVPVVKTIGPSKGKGDDTQRIQDAINAVAGQTSTNNRGALLLKAGTYYIDGTLRIKHGGIVLRGSGDGTDPSKNTIIIARGNTPKHRTAIVLGTDDISPFKRSGAGVDVTDEFVPAGAMNFDIANPSHFHVGEEIEILHPSTQAWINAVKGGGTASDGPWIAGQEDIPYIRKITKISGSRIYLDAPIYNSLKYSLGPSKVYPIVSSSNVIRESGVENLRVDIKTKGGNDINHAWFNIDVIGAEDCWVRNVAALHFTHSGFRVAGALRVTIKNSSATDPVGPKVPPYYYNFDAYHYAQLILFIDDHSEGGRHDFVDNGAENSSGIVWTHSTVKNGGTTGGHRHWTTGLLYDDITSTGGLTLQLYNRGSYGTKHGWTTANSTIWNSKATISVQKPPTAQNYAISGRGHFSTNFPFKGPVGYHDIRPGEKLNPESLYDAQLCDRLEH